VSWERTKDEICGVKSTVGVVDGLARGLEVHLRGFCCKARGGGGRLRHATKIEKKEKKQEKEDIYNNTL